MSDVSVLDSVINFVPGIDIVILPNTLYANDEGKLHDLCDHVKVFHAHRCVRVCVCACVRVCVCVGVSALTLSRSCACVRACVRV